MSIPPRFDVTPEQIDRVVAVFYAAIRRHEVLGPIFNAHVTDWPEHEEKIARFWRNAILRERGLSPAAPGRWPHQNYGKAYAFRIMRKLGLTGS